MNIDPLSIIQEMQEIEQRIKQDMKNGWESVEKNIIDSLPPGVEPNAVVMEAYKLIWNNGFKLGHASMAAMVKEEIYKMPKGKETLKQAEQSLGNINN